MNALTPLAVANADVLRQLGQSALTRPESIAALARGVGRDDANVRKSVKALQGAGLLDDSAPVPALTPAGDTALAAIERADGADAQPASQGPAGFVELYHAQILPDPANARHASMQKGVEEWTGPEIAWDAEAASIERLRDELSLVTGGRRPEYRDRRYHLRLVQSGHTALTGRFGTLDTLNKVELALKAHRSALLGAEGKAALKGAYATPWLNGPFELSPKEVERAEAMAREAAELEERKAAEEKALTEQEAAVAGIEREALTGVPFGFDQTLIRLMAGSYPLPWRHDGDVSNLYIFASNGQEVPLYFGPGAFAFARLIVLAVNAAAELATPTPLIEGEGDDTHSDAEALEEA